MESEGAFAKQRGGGGEAPKALWFWELCRARHTLEQELELSLPTATACSLESSCHEVQPHMEQLEEDIQM